MAKERGKEWEEYDNAVRWMTITFAIAVVVTVVFMYIAPILAFFMQNGISKKSVEIAGLFLKKSFADFGFLWDWYLKWFKKVYRYSGEFKISLWPPILPFISFPLILIIGGIKCPYKFQSNIHGSAHIATLRDIEKMQLLGFDGFCMVVGKFQGKMLKLKETLSTLCCAPPGTGKTAGVVIPTIFNSEGLSIIVTTRNQSCATRRRVRETRSALYLSSTGVRKTIRQLENTIRVGTRCLRERSRHRGRNATCMSILCATRWWKTPRAALTRTGQKPVEARSAALSILSLPNANGL